MTRDEIKAEIAELETANEIAPGWGAAVGARLERIRGLRRELRRIEKDPTSTPHPAGLRPSTLSHKGRGTPRGITPDNFDAVLADVAAEMGKPS